VTVLVHEVPAESPQRFQAVGFEEAPHGIVGEGIPYLSL
jgi:hypothetical protein